MGVMTACGASTTDAGISASDPERVEAPLPAVDLSRAPVADDPDPSISAGAAADHLDCQHGIWAGMGSIDFGDPPSADDPDGALVVFLEGSYFPLPQNGFVATGEDDGRRLFTYTVGGRSKASVVVADSSIIALDTESGWAVEAFAACDPAEFDPSNDEQVPWEIWLDADGNRLPSSTVRTYRGPEHCDWESATYLTIEGHLYVSDPNGVLGDIGAVAPFSDDAELPANAIDTAYHRDDRRLWLSNDRTTAYVVRGDRVEAWPSVTDPPGCA